MNRRNLILSALAYLVPTGAIADTTTIHGCAKMITYPEWITSFEKTYPEILQIHAFKQLEDNKIECIFTSNHLSPILYGKNVKLVMRPKWNKEYTSVYPGEPHFMEDFEQ